MLGNKIYYIDTTNERVASGVVCGVSVNEEGFKVLSIKTADNAYLVHFASLCFDTEEAAAADLERAIAINKEIKNIQTEANHKIDFLLEQLRGKPEYYHLTIAAEATRKDNCDDEDRTTTEI